MSLNSKRQNPVVARHPLTVLAATTVVVLLAGCHPDDDGTRVAGWSLVDPSQRHPIMVSQQPTTLSIRATRGSYGLTPAQRAQTIAFLERYRSRDSGASRLVIQAPSGAANEVASMQAVAEIRSLMGEIGFGPSNIAVEAYHAGGEHQPAIKVSYLQYVAEGPECGHWESNLAETESNLSFPNLGCANQRNFAAMVANPADLLGPRTITPRPGERRDTVWEKYIKGESTGASKGDEEKTKVKSGGN